MKIQRDTTLGLVFFGGLGFLGWATVSLTSLSFEPKPQVVVYFDNALGLRDGDPVNILGTRYGIVKEVALSAQADAPPIRVVMELDRPLPPLTSTKTIEIRQANLLGGSQIDIDPGNGSPSPDANELRGEHRPSALQALGDADVTGTVQSIKRTFDKINDPRGSVGALLDDREAFDDFAATLKSMRTTMEQIESGEGPLGRLIYNEEMAQDLSAAVRELRILAHKINEGDGLASRVVNDAEMASNLAMTFDDIRALTGSLRRGNGMAGRILSDPDTEYKFDRTMDSVASATSKLNDPNAGILGAALADPQMRQDAQNLVANLEDASAKINEGRGMLGKLISDEALAAQFDRLVQQITGAIEDAREAAPVGTFFQVLASPF